MNTSQTSSINSLPEELLTQILTQSQATELAALQATNPYLRATLQDPTRLAYIIPRVIRRYYEDEDKALSQMMKDNLPEHRADAALKLAIAMTIEVDLLEKGAEAMSIGILERCLLPPSVRDSLEGLSDKFALFPGSIAPCNIDNDSAQSTMRDIVKTGITSYRRAAIHPQYMKAWRQAYNRAADRGSLGYLLFLHDFSARIDKAAAIALIFEGQLFPPSPQDLIDVRRTIIDDFLLTLSVYAELNPELGIDLVELDYNRWNAFLSSSPEQGMTLSTHSHRIIQGWGAVMSGRLRSQVLRKAESAGLPVPTAVPGGQWVKNQHAWTPEGEYWEPANHSDREKGISKWGAAEFNERVRLSKLWGTQDAPTSVREW